MSCYCCVINCAQIHDPLGNEGDMLGACYLCHAHACGHHADRSADDAQYLCVLCEKTLLTASSFLRTRNSDYTRNLLAQTGNERLLTLRREYAFRNVRQFARLHPRVWEAISATPQWNHEEAARSLHPQFTEILNTEEKKCYWLRCASPSRFISLVRMSRGFCWKPVRNWHPKPPADGARDDLEIAD